MIDYRVGFGIGILLGTDRFTWDGNINIVEQMVEGWEPGIEWKGYWENIMLPTGWSEMCRHMTYRDNCGLETNFWREGWPDHMPDMAWV